MTDLAQRDRNEMTAHRQASDSPLPGKLKLSGRVPVRVYVSYYPASGNPDGKETVGFGLTAAGPFHGGGLKWGSLGTEYSKFVTFEFPAEVAEVSCKGLAYSASYSTGPAEQDLCILPAPGTDPVIYHFKVHFNSGMVHDPQIIVTPINGDDD